MTLTLFLCSVATSSHSQDTLTIQPQKSMLTDSLVEIWTFHLPEVIIKNISSDDYSGWILQKAYKAIETTPNQRTRSSYVVELRKDDETIRMWFDEQGNPKID